MQGTGTLPWTRRKFGGVSLLAGMGACVPAWMRAAQMGPNAPAAVAGSDSLRAHAAMRGLRFGTAVVPELLDVDGVAAGNSTDPYTQLIQGQANILVAENAMKWAALRPTPDTFDFAQADRLMQFAGLTGDGVRGHNLCWSDPITSNWHS